MRGERLLIICRELSENPENDPFGVDLEFTHSSFITVGIKLLCTHIASRLYDFFLELVVHYSIVWFGRTERVSVRSRLVVV